MKKYLIFVTVGLVLIFGTNSLAAPPGGGQGGGGWFCPRFAWSQGQ